MGIFDNLFGKNSPVTAVTNLISSKKQNAISQTQSQPNVPLGNLKKVGGNVSYIDEGDKIDYSTQNFYTYPSGNAEVIIQTKKEQNSGSDVTQSSEKGPGSSNTAGSGSSIEDNDGKNNILTYALIGAGILAGVYILKN